MSRKSSSSIFVAVLLLLSVILAPLRLSAVIIPPTALDSLRRELSRATTPQDSLPILYNIFDCTLTQSRNQLVDTIYAVAHRAHNDDGMLESLFLLTNFNDQNKDKEQQLLDMYENITDSELRRSRIIYTKVRFQLKKISFMTEEERQKAVLKLLAKHNESKHLDRYEKIEYLFTLCSYLRNVTDADMLLSYLNELQGLIEELPHNAMALKFMFYTTASAAALENHLYDLAVSANKRILDIADDFDKHYEAQGREFRNNDGTLYTSYNNILKSRAALTQEEVDSFYQCQLEIAARNPRIGDNKRLQQRTTIFYLMAKKRYAEALPLIKKELSSLGNGSTSYNFFVDALIEAAEGAGSEDDLLMGLQLSNKNLKERNATKSDVNLKELLTIYDVENLKEENLGLVNENERIDIDGRKESLVWIFVAALAVICMIVWMISMYLHSRWLGKRLFASNKKLIEERNTLEDTYAKLVEVRDQAKAAHRVKNDFVENMSNEIRVPLGAIVEYSHLIADFAEEDERPYIREYGEVMSVNTDLMIRLVNDILDLPTLESGSLSIHRSPSSVKGICNFALELVKKHISPGVKIIFTNEGQPDATIITDPQRVEQVLIQVLINAAKFTESGSITFGYEINPARDKITFTVTDTGIGVPRGMEEAIFDRFVKIDPTTQGNGLGLYIGRLLANMLDGSLTLDNEYRTGAKFIFTIPII